MMNNTSTILDRRSLLLSTLGMAALAVSGCSRRRDRPTAVQRLTAAKPAETLYPALLNEQFPVPAVSPGKLAKKFQRQLVRYPTSEKAGTVVVDTRRFFLYHVQKDGTAMRYGVGLGREGFAWSGRARVAWKRKWPKWTPPKEMIARQPELAKWGVENGGMPPGLDNPLGARALYIFEGNEDTLYRLHGTSQVSSIGRAVSSGCVRLVNQDIIHLYDNVRSGSTLVVI